jgi:alginate O-acetyltransferase complex protein AlgI
MKIVVIAETYSGRNGLKPFQWLAFSVGWFGMRAPLFEKLPAQPLAYSRLIWKGLSRIVTGLCLLYLSAAAGQYPGAAKYFLPQLLLLVGLSLILHFGVLNLSTASWRHLGVDVTELFKAPYKATSLKEFWGKRWNIAFSEMTALIAYRPLARQTGSGKAILASFLLSGLLHEIAISLPVRAGYGLPMLYFIIHAVAMQLEAKSPWVQRITQHKILSHIWVMAWLIIPMPLLFHSKFIAEVLVPLRNLLLGFAIPV